MKRKPGDKRFRWLWGALGLIGLVGAYFVFQDKIVDVQLRPLVQSELAKAVNGPVSIQSIRASLTGHVVLNGVDLTIPGHPWKSHVAVERLSVNMDLIGLVFRHKPLEDCFKRVSFEKPQVTLIRDEEKDEDQSSPVKKAVAAPAADRIPLPVIPAGEISVSRGLFALQTGKSPRNIIRNVNFEATTHDGVVWGVSLEAASPQAGSQGMLSFSGSFNVKAIKVLGKINLSQWPLVSGNSTLHDLSGWELQDGTIDVESPLVVQPGHVWFDAATTLSNASIKSPAPLGVVFANINGRAFIRPTDLNIPGELTFQVGQTPWKASGLIPFDGRSMAVHTSTEQLYLASLFDTLFKDSDLKVDGTGSASFVATGTLRDPELEGTAQLGASHIGSLAIDSFSVKAGYEKGRFNLFEVGGKLYDGSFTSNGFVDLNGQADAPVTLNAVLTNLDAKKMASSFGIAGMDGTSHGEIHLGGTIGEPVLTADGLVDLTRTLQDELKHYYVKMNVLLRDQKLKFYTVVDDKKRTVRLDGQATEVGNDWVLDEDGLSLKIGKKIERLTSRGSWPKKMDTPLDLEIAGDDLLLEDVPFLQDQFKDIRGQVSFDIHLTGTRKDPQAVLEVNSDEITLGSLEPQPMTVSLGWKAGTLTFNQFKVGEILQMTGQLGLDAQAPMDLKIKAKGVPIPVLTELSGWNNPPKPFSGWITGDLHVAGTQQNPIVEGNGVIDSLQVAEWNADRVEGLLSLEQGKLQIKKLTLIQLKPAEGPHTLSVTGTWDTQSKPGIMAIKLSADHFQLAGKPFLSGDFNWNAETGERFWKDWKGSFTSADFSLGDGKDNAFHFTDFSINASFENMILQGKVGLGKSIYGSATLDLSGEKPELAADLRVGPVLFNDAPNLTQFIPSSLRVKGTVSGELKVKKAPFDEMPMNGSFTVTNGSIQAYDFDKVELSFMGDKHKIEPKFSLSREDAKYALAGTLASPSAFWSPDADVNINGPVQNEKLSNLLSLFKFKFDKHQVSGLVNGNLGLTGKLSRLTIGFSINGQNLQYEDQFITSASLNFTEADGKITLGKNQLNLEKGELDINQGTVQLDKDDPSLVLMEFFGQAKDLQISAVTMNELVHLSGKLSLASKEGRPDFEGLLSVSEPMAPSQKSNGDLLSFFNFVSGPSPAEKARAKKAALAAKPFDLSISLSKKIVTLKPIDNDHPQLVGSLDLSDDKKMVFQDIHLINSPKSFSLDGTLDPNGKSKLVSDAKDVPIEDIGRWLMPNFPLNGTAGYHLVFEGGLDDPIFTASFSVVNGIAQDLQFNLLSGELKSHDNVLYFGSEDAPVELSKTGSFDFTLQGKMPFALTKESWDQVHNNEMDISAKMSKGDFGIIQLAGFAKKASGSMDLDAHVTGTLDNPVLNLDLDLLKCQFVPPMICQSVNDLNGHIKVRDNVLAIYGLNAQIGKGRIFLTSPPIEVSKMKLVDFIPQYLDLNLQSVGTRGVWISVPTIMDTGEWGEVFFYGATPDAPMRIVGDIAEPHVIGTAKMETGHYTFPPKETKDPSGKNISFPALGRVFFELDLLAGSDCWYSNDSYTQYLEVRVNPGDHLHLRGKDQDRTEEHPGIYSSGQAGTKEGYLRYLGHEFKVDEASLYIPHGRLPVMWGRATDTLENVEIVTAGGVRTTNMDIWISFHGSFGNIDFTLDSSPHFTTNDSDLQQKLLLSYIMFGRDMTGYTSQQLQAVYQQNTGSVVPDAILQTIDRVASNNITSIIRGPVQNATGLGINFKSQVLSGGGANGQATPGANAVIAEPYGNTVTGSAVPLAQVEINKSLDSRLTVKSVVGVGKNLTTDAAQGQFEVGAEYGLTKNLKVDVMSGGNDYGQNETKLGLSYSAQLPDIMMARPDDKQTPKFMRYDISDFGLGRFQIDWSTDLVTRGEIKVVDEDKNVVKDIVEKTQQTYDHQTILDKLNPEMGYQVQIIAKYLNGNEAVSIKSIAPQVQDESK